MNELFIAHRCHGSCGIHKTCINRAILYHGTPSYGAIIAVNYNKIITISSGTTYQCYKLHLMTFIRLEHMYSNVMQSNGSKV